MEDQQNIQHNLKTSYFKALMISLGQAILDSARLHIPYRSAALSFYTITAIVPLMMVLVFFMSYLNLDITTIFCPFGIIITH